MYFKSVVERLYKGDNGQKSWGGKGKIRGRKGKRRIIGGWGF